VQGIRSLNTTNTQITAPHQNVATVSLSQGLEQPRKPGSSRSPSGPKRQVILRQWVSSICDLWESFGRAVTIDYQAGQASSKTYEFLE
jgi:hypothetical protein